MSDIGVWLLVRSFTDFSSENVNRVVLCSSSDGHDILEDAPDADDDATHEESMAIEAHYVGVIRAQIYIVLCTICMHQDRSGRVELDIIVAACWPAPRM